MTITIIKTPIKKNVLAEHAREGFGDFIKVAVDIEQGIMAIGAELHADEEVLLMEQEGSKKEHLWGINLYPQRTGDDWIEFDSMINLKPALGNRSRGVDDPGIREKIQAIVDRLVAQ